MILFFFVLEGSMFWQKKEPVSKFESQIQNELIKWVPKV